MRPDTLGGPNHRLVWDRWMDHAARRPEQEAIVHWVAGEEPHRWRWGDLMSAASRVAHRLREENVRAGDVCALIIRHHRNFYPIYMGVSALGALPAVLAYPNPRLHPEKFRHGLEGMARRSGLDWVLTEAALDPLIRPLVVGESSSIRGILLPTEWEIAGGAEIPVKGHAETEPSDPCLLQHSSGTTGLQKAVVLSHRAILEHVARYGESIGLGAEDRVVTWLPLYHDMGLIAAFYVPLTFGVPLVQLDPFEWVSAPVLLLEAISRERGTVCWLPNFAYNLMADRIHDEDLEGLRLDSVRMLINCSEPVRADSHDRFHRRFSSYGLRRETLAACYAMAETTYAVTQTPPGSEARRIHADRADLARGVVRIGAAGESARACVSSGPVIPGCEIRVVDASRSASPKGQVGEIAIRSVSMFDGYRNNAEKTAEVLEDGWYYSGDYGFEHEGECYVIGRKKDLIIVAGKNIYPEDIEDAIGQVPGVYPGRVVAFGADDPESGTERICVVAETSAVPEDERKTVKLAIVEAGMAIDVTISRVYLVPARWMIKSSSGKPSRQANRERALQEVTPA
jgi:fatty-acyl-CoA synthase